MNRMPNPSLIYAGIVLLIPYHPANEQLDIP
jgi:hypothetical protein